MRDAISGPCGIIISTGRCGSTLLSTLIAEEPATLSVQESLGPVLSHLASPGHAKHVTGAQYWRLLSRPYSGSEAMSRAGAALGGHDGVSPIMLVTLPRIAADPGRLYGMLAEMVPHFPPQPVGPHHKMLLDLLAALTGKHRWVERSGASSPVAGALLRAMPEARIVYLTRDIADAARSMSKHLSFQFALARYEFHQRYNTDPYSTGPRACPVPAAAELPGELRRVLPDRITAAALRDLGSDTSRYEAMCASMMSLAEQAFADLKPPHLHRMRYEDLRTSPVTELSRLGGFLGFADPAAWAAKTAQRVRPPRSHDHGPNGAPYAPNDPLVKWSGTTRTVPGPARADMFDSDYWRWHAEKEAARKSWEQGRERVVRATDALRRENKFVGGSVLGPGRAEVFPGSPRRTGAVNARLPG